MIHHISKETKAMSIKLNPTARILASFLLALALPHRLAAAGPDPVNLGSTTNFAILAGAAITSTGGGTINGDVGATPITGAAIGVACVQMNGIIYAVDAAGPACRVTDPSRLTTAMADLTTAYNDAAGRPAPTGTFPESRWREYRRDEPHPRSLQIHQYRFDNGSGRHAHGLSR